MAPPSHPVRALMVHILRIKGVAEPEALAVPSGVDVAVLRPLLTELVASGLVERRRGGLSGWGPTALGAKLGDAWLAEELEAAPARQVVEEAYRKFLVLNPELLVVCTQWQLRSIGGTLVANDHSDPAYDAEVVARLADLHRRALPVVEGLGRALRRFGPYRTRLQGAFDYVAAGHGDWFTRPLIDSYHQAWFELHQDLLLTLGRSRTGEGAGGSVD